MACRPLDIPIEFVAEVDVGSGKVRLDAAAESRHEPRVPRALQPRAASSSTSRSKEFADEFPGVAERLGGLGEETDGPGHRQPARGQRLHGGARAAQAQERVFRVHLGAARPAAAELSGADPVGGAGPGGRRLSRIPASSTASVFARGAYIDAVYVEQERRVACRFRLRRELALWPLSLETAEYFAAPAPLQALGLEVAPGVDGGTAARLPAADGAPRHGEAERAEGRRRRSRTCKVDDLPVHILGADQRRRRALRAALRQLPAHHHPLSRCVRRPAVHRRAAAGAAADRLRRGRDPVRARRPVLFRASNLLRDFFAFPSKFLGFRLQRPAQAAVADRCAGLRHALRVRRRRAAAASVVNPDMFALYTVPAVNLFEMSCSRVPVRRSEHEHHVVPDRSRVLDFEAHRIIDVFAHYPGRRRRRCAVFPLYSLPDRERARARRALLHDAPAAAPPHLAGAARRRAQQLCRHRAVPVAVRAGGDRRPERVRELSVRVLAPTGISPTSCRSATPAPIST